MPFDRVSDIRPSGEYDVVGVAFCVGTDMDGAPITLMNRACLNEEAADYLAARVSACEQQTKIYSSITDRHELELKDLEWRRDAWFFSSTVLALIILFCLAAVYRLARPS